MRNPVMQTMVRNLWDQTQGLISKISAVISWFFMKTDDFCRNWLRFSPPPFSEREQIQDIYIIFTCCIIFTCFLVPQIVNKIILPFLLTDEELIVRVSKWNLTISVFENSIYWISTPYLKAIKQTIHLKIHFTENTIKRTV